jgi:hypothetical protein
MTDLHRSLVASLLLLAACNGGAAEPRSASTPLGASTPGAGQNPSPPPVSPMTPSMPPARQAGREAAPAAAASTAAWLGSIVLRGEQIEQIDVHADGRCVRLRYHGLQLEIATEAHLESEAVASFQRLASTLLTTTPAPPDAEEADDTSITIHAPAANGAIAQRTHASATLPAAIGDELQRWLGARDREPGEPAAATWFEARPFASAMGLPPTSTGPAIAERLRQRGQSWQILTAADALLAAACARPGLLLPGDDDIRTTPAAPRIVESGGAFFAVHAIRRR